MIRYEDSAIPLWIIKTFYVANTGFMSTLYCRTLQWRCFLCFCWVGEKIDLRHGIMLSHSTYATVSQGNTSKCKHGKPVRDIDTIKDQCNPYRTKQDWNHTDTGSNWEYMGLCWTIQDLAGPYRTNLGFTGPYGTLMRFIR